MTDLQLSTTRASLPCIVVVDGNISFSSLATLQKDIDWLYNQLNITSKKKLKNIIFAQWDEQNNKMITHKKIRQNKISLPNFLIFF